MVDIARLLAQRGIVVTIITTPLNAKRFERIIVRAIESGLQIRVIQLHFPCVEAGLPLGCENLDFLISMDSASQFFDATGMLQPSVEQLFEELNPKPNCLISDVCYPWTTNVAHKFQIPKLVFSGTCCFSLLCIHNLNVSRVRDNLTSKSERFVVPSLPDRIEMTKAHIPGIVKLNSFDNLTEITDEIRKGEQEAYGVIVNTFEELETGYVKEYSKATGKKVWCIGPVSMCNKNNLDKVERGNKTSIDENNCFKWLDSWEPGSIVYVCLGSLSRLATSQIIELGLGLEASKRPFIWVIRYKVDDFEKWILEEEFEERIKGRGLLIHGWAPQVLILSHMAIGGFLTHCGWNSTLEGVSAGVPMLTWPIFAEQFCNEKLLVHVMRIGVRVGVEISVNPGKEELVGVLVKKDDIKMAIDKLMDKGEEGENRRERAKKFREMTNRTVEDGGSSHLNMIMLIHVNPRYYGKLKTMGNQQLRLW